MRDDVGRRVAAFRAAVQYRSWQLMSMLVRVLPLPVAYGIARIAGFVGFWAWPSGRRAMMSNFRQVLPRAPEAHRRRIARRSLQNYCAYLVDFARLPAMSAEAVRAAAHGDRAFADLDRALDAGRGAIVVCVHFGNWDLGAAAAAARGYSVAAVGERFGDPRLDAAVFSAREALGMRIMPLGQAMPSIVRQLRQNGLVALLIDRPTEQGEGVEVEFFGEPITVPAGAARLALRTGASVGAVASPRRVEGRPEVDVLARFGLEGGDGSAPTVTSITQAVMHEHERFIRRYPDQWYKFQELWPAAPKGAEC